MKKILLALELDGDEKVLLDKALNFAEAFGAKVWMLHIAAPDPDFVGYEVGPQSERDFRANQLKKKHKLWQDYSDELNKGGVEAEALLIQGTTVETIIEESVKLEADLIIAGYEEHGLIHKIIFGRNSERLMRKSRIPILLVPFK